MTSEEESQLLQRSEEKRTGANQRSVSLILRKENKVLYEELFC